MSRRLSTVSKTLTIQSTRTVSLSSVFFSHDDDDDDDFSSILIDLLFHFSLIFDNLIFCYYLLSWRDLVETAVLLVMWKG